MPPVDDATRVAHLIAAQDKAVALFDEVLARDIVRAGVSERDASDAVRDLAVEMFGAKRHWHKRIVRAGPNTLLPYQKNPRDRMISDDDIVFLDFGPIFDGWEADYGRTMVIGSDPRKLELRDTLQVLFDLGVEKFRSTPDITGSQLYEYVVAETEARGFQWGGEMAGHVVGKFPHDAVPGDKQQSRIAPGNDETMRRVDNAGNPAHWILEIHVVDRALEIGGFFEELLLEA